MWTAKLRDNYDNDFEQFEAYDRSYGLVERLGFRSAEQAWEANPQIKGSTNPADFGIAGTHVSYRLTPGQSDGHGTGRPGANVYTGYVVDVWGECDNGEPVERYEAGNSALDSGASVEPRSPDALNTATLRRYARQTAQEMARSHGLTDHDVRHDKDGEDEAREMVNARP